MHPETAFSILCRANAVVSKMTAEERNAATKSRSPLKNSVSTLNGKRQTFGLGLQQQDGETDGEQAASPTDNKEEDAAKAPGASEV